MRKAEVRWWIGILLVLFGGTIAFNIANQKGGFAYYLHNLDGVEILGSLFVATLSTVFALWHASTIFGLLFVTGLLLVLSRSGRLRSHLPEIGLFAVLIVLPCVFFWNITRHHLPTAGGFLLSLLWLAAPVILYLCVRHTIIRKDETWSRRDRRIAYLGASVAFLLVSLSTGTIRSDAEVDRSLQRGRDVVYAIKHYQRENRRLPDSLDDLVPNYFSDVPLTDVPRRWNGRQGYVYRKQGQGGFTVSFQSASYVSCGYERSRDGWECE